MVWVGLFGLVGLVGLVGLAACCADGIELAILLNTLLAFVPIVVMADRHTITMSDSMTAYSIAVGPSSAARKRRMRENGCMVFDLAFHRYHGKCGRHNDSTVPWNAIPTETDYWQDKSLVKYRANLRSLVLLRVKPKRRGTFS